MDCILWEGLMLEQFMKNCRPWEGLTLKKFMKDCIPWEGPHTGAGKEHQLELVAEMKCYEWITIPIPHLPVPLEKRR